MDGFHTNLISFGQLVTDNYLVGKVTDKLIILQVRASRMLIGEGEREGEGLYHFRGLEIVTSLQTGIRNELVLWHKRLGHPSLQVTESIPGVVYSISSSNELSIKSCEICFRAKQTRQYFPDSLNNANEVFDLIHCDLWGPYRTTAFCGSRYFLTIVDDHSRAVWLYLLTDKTMAPLQLQNFVAMIERQFSKKVKRIRSDNGSEFICLTLYFQEKGIVHKTSCVHTPQQNRRVERKHRHILNIARALRFQESLPIEYWGECVLTAAYLINGTPSQVLKNKTPFEVLFGHAPGYKHLRVLGCLPYAHNSDHKGDKFASRSTRCVFLGYPYGKKGWKLYDLERKTIFVSRDVVFQEDTFPFAESERVQAVNEPLLTTTTDDTFDTESNEENSPHIVSEPTHDSSNNETQVADEHEALTHDTVTTLGRGQRQKFVSIRLKDYIVQTVTTKSTPLSLYLSTRSSANLRYNVSHL